jgi:hypothetical protein
MLHLHERRVVVPQGYRNEDALLKVLHQQHDIADAKLNQRIYRSTTPDGQYELTLVFTSEKLDFHRVNKYGL